MTPQPNHPTAIGRPRLRLIRLERRHLWVIAQSFDRLFDGEVFIQETLQRKKRPQARRVGAIVHPVKPNRVFEMGHEVNALATAPTSGAPSLQVAQYCRLHIEPSVDIEAEADHAPVQEIQGVGLGALQNIPRACHRASLLDAFLYRECRGKVLI